MFSYSCVFFRSALENKNIQIIGARKNTFYSCKFYSKLRGTLLKNFEKNSYHLMSNLKAISTELIKEKKALEKKTGKKVIFSPLHLFSDEFSVIAACLHNKNKVNCIANIGNNGWKENWGAKNDDNHIENLNMIDVLQTSRKNANRSMLKIISDFKHHGTDLVIFLDALPEYTCAISRLSLNSAPAKLKKIEIFGKVGLMHRGPFYLPEKLDAILLPYQVVATPFGLKLITHSPLENKLENEIPKTIERVLKSKFSEQWMFWDFTSFYYYNGIVNEK